MRQDNWIGRCRAEQQLCQAVHMVTLTYAPEYEDGPDPLAAKHFVPRDYQNWIRKLKARGHNIRYIVTGEAGGLKGRVHWHLLLFWYSKPWDAVLSTRDAKGKLIARHWCPKGAWYNKHRLPEQDHWPHGHLVVENVQVANSRKAISYVTKYMLKDAEGDRQSYFAASHNIGTAWITQVWAKHVVDQGKCPDKYRDYTCYSFAEDRSDPKGAWKYRMHPTVAAKFAKALEQLWDERGRIPPRSEAHFHFLAKWDTLFYPAADQVPHRPEPYRAQARRAKYTDLPAGLWHDVKLGWSEPHNTDYFDDPDTGIRYYWGPSSIEPGRWDWQQRIRSARDVAEDELQAAQQARPIGQPIGLPPTRQRELTLS